jgi:hypothetical protein
MSKAQQHTDKQLQSCVGTANAILDAIAAGRVARHQAKDGLPDHFEIQGIIFPSDESGRKKVLAATALALDAINEQVSGHSRVQAGWKQLDAAMGCWVEDFDTSKLRVRAAKEHVRNVFKEVLKEMPDPIKAFDKDPVPESDAYWVGPFSARKMDYVDTVMQLLLSFHGIESIKSQLCDLHNGQYAVKCSASELQPLLLKEGMARRDSPPLQ